MSGELRPGVSIEELIARAKAGDRAALEKLFEWCKPVIDDWASRRLGKKQAGVARPSDIAQEAGVRAFRSFDSFAGTTETQLFAWLRSIFDSSTSQAFRDAGRKKRDNKGETPLDGPDAVAALAPQLSPSQVTAGEEQWQRVFRGIFQLPEEQKRAIWLCHMKGLRVAEAAKHMGKTEPAVASLLRRGLRTLRERASSDPDQSSAEPAVAPPEQEDAAAALLSYLGRREAGASVDAAVFAAEHPSCAEELRVMIEWIERIEALRPTNLEE
jgi:RNA polymerase sigma-70 factor (ECF subfamily)